MLQVNQYITFLKIDFILLCINVFFKRVIDIILSLCLLFIVWPFLLLAIFFLYFANKGAGVFFTQERPGKNAKTFKVIKFKTMTDERDTDGKLLPDDKRLTKTGRVVRSLSIDELPQLFNVLKGDMALIGPRPLLPKYLPLYSSEQFRRHEVRPGITGWAQVMVEIIYLGGKNSNWMCGMWIIVHFFWI